MEASDLVGKDWTCPKCNTKEVINASGIDHKCSNYYIIKPLKDLYIETLIKGIDWNYEVFVPILNEEEDQ